MVRDLQTVKRKVKRFERHLREKVQLVGVLVPVIGKMVRFLCFSFRPLGLRPRRRLTKKALDQEGISPIRANLTPTGGVRPRRQISPIRAFDPHWGQELRSSHRNVNINKIGSRTVSPCSC